MRFSVLLFLILVQPIFALRMIDANYENISLKQLGIITSQIIEKPISNPFELDYKVSFRSKEKISSQKLLELFESHLNQYGFILMNTDDGYKVQRKVQKQKAKKSTIIPKKKSVAIVDLQYKQATKLVKIIEAMAQNMENTSFVGVDEESNCILLMGSYEDVEQLKMTIEYLDKQHPQVFVETKIVEISSNRVKNIGIQFGLAGGMIGQDGIFSYAANMNGSVSIEELGGTIFNIKNLQKGLALGATINLLKENMALDIVSEPSILCTNNQEASIYVGKTVSILTQTSGTGDTQKDSYNRENIGLSLKIQPRINNQNKVHLSIDTILEDIDTLQGTNDQPITSKKQVNTAVVVGHGQSVILGGLIKNQNSATIQKIPFLGDIPVLGNLFTNHYDVNDKINLVVIVTPYIIPANKDLAYAREQLAKLKVLEHDYTIRLMENLQNRKKD